MSQAYTSGSLQVLEGLDAVRLRPGMYIGSTGPRGLHHLLWEIVDNAVDEASSGYARNIAVTLHGDGSASVWDDGRGVPVDPHPTLGIPGIELVYTRLHAGGKFDGRSYSQSGGLHGVGASVVNALSSWMTVDSYRDWTHWQMRFESVYDKKEKKLLPGHPVSGLVRVGNTRKRGTLVCFKPDEAVFEDTAFSADLIARRLRELAYLVRGVRITFADTREGSPDKSPREYLYEGGIADYVRYLTKDKAPLHEVPIVLEGNREGIHLSVAMLYTDAYAESVFSYANNIPTPEGGSHETGFKAALTRSLNDYARRTGILREKDASLSGEDVREGLTAIVSVKLSQPQFEGQTKGRLGNSEVRPVAEALAAGQLTLFFEDLRNHDTAQRILEKALRAARVREAARKAKEVARAKSTLEAAPLVGKLSSCTGRNPQENELLIVEGDSAGGSAKQGRDRRFQAVLPLRGKPLNVEKRRLDQVLGNEEFRSIITALGTGIDEDFQLTQLRYHKVIILSDADQDGAHIRAILLTFFFRYMRDLVSQGHVYIGMPPLYQVRAGSAVHYAYDDRGLKALTAGRKNYSVQRYKGLGEMNPEQLWETTMDPQRRRLLQVTLEDCAEAERIITILMGDKVDPRREYISAHADFAKPDAFVTPGTAAVPPSVEGPVRKEG